jgi:hypothetical protein
MLLMRSKPELDSLSSPIISFINHLSAAELNAPFSLIVFLPLCNTHADALDRALVRPCLL